MIERVGARSAWPAAALVLAMNACGSTTEMGAIQESHDASDDGAHDATGGAAGGGAGGTGGSGTGGYAGGYWDAGTGGVPICPPCAGPPRQDCIGQGVCGCGPYLCPDAGVDGSPGDLVSSCGGGLGTACPASPPLDGTSCSALDLCCNYVVPPAYECPVCELGMRGCICNGQHWSCAAAACACVGEGDGGPQQVCAKNDDCGVNRVCVAYVTNIGPTSSTQHVCRDNPCGGGELTCSCAASLCPKSFPGCIGG